MIEGVPFAHRETTTFVGALRVTSFTTPVTIDVLTVDGPINGCIFLAWLRQHLVPTLAPGDIVVIDHPSSHQAKGVREAIESVVDEILNPATMLARFESNQL